MHWLQINTYRQHLFLWGRIFSFVCVIHGTIGILLFWCYRSNFFYFKASVHAQAQIPVFFDERLVFSAKKTSAVVKKVDSKQKIFTKKVCKKEEQGQKNTKKESKEQALSVQNNIVETSKKEDLPKNELKKQVRSVQEKSNKPVKVEDKSTEKEQIASATEIERAAQENQQVLLFSQLQKQIIAEWNAPIGMPKDTACTISFFIDLKGFLQHITIDSSSGILMYDLSARAAITKTIMPRWSRGKSFTITFHA